MEETAYALIKEQGYTLLFVTVLAGVIGFPLPDEGLLIFAGTLVAKGWLDPLPTCLCCVAAVALGSTFNYWLASRPRRRWLFRCSRKWGLSKKRIRTTLMLMDRYGGCAIAFCYFIPGARMAMSYLAGLIRLRIRTFAVGSVFGIFAWVGFYLWLGWMLV
ncbi:hypothetical protein GCM10011571_32320 [Marinithermofilum abyssi]|uniref:VTT domain-containing protein n=1 Tax=Marinithermofilum abyssi TaxID=1571185 RepID=A0A8J2VET2_9BACL|nr:DedA family protein [Marinithermofilum abyssi]GGE27650.1 hypothetical protein GCM10011571_32320 [Marinithermofilum abyssi]